MGLFRKKGKNRKADIKFEEKRFFGKTEILAVKPFLKRIDEKKSQAFASVLVIIRIGSSY